MRILDRFKATFEHKSDKPHEQTESKNPKWKQEKGTMKDEHRESDNSLEKDFLDTYLQTKGTPLGNPMDAWNWVMEKIAYFKENGLDRNKLYSLERNVLLYLTPCYLSRFAEFQTTVDDVAPVIQTCEFLLKAENPLMSKQIAEPYVRHKAIRHLEKKRVCIFAGGIYGDRRRCRRQQHTLFRQLLP